MCFWPLLPHAAELCEAGVNLKEIQRRLGHKSMEITNRMYQAK